MDYSYKFAVDAQLSIQFETKIYLQSEIIYSLCLSNLHINMIILLPFLFLAKLITHLAFPI